MTTSTIKNVNPFVSTLELSWVDTTSTSVKVGVKEVNILTTPEPLVKALGVYDVLVNEILVIALFQFFGGIGANNNKISLNLSTAVPIGVEGTKSVKIPSVYVPSSAGPIAILADPLVKSKETVPATVSLPWLSTVKVGISVGLP